ncbi:MAG: hypothetical protein FWC72_06075, partial [Oscillospiraceae bacterium]|nr:hypothetical protein [Oscillospiraceae bacterium]
MKKFIPCLLILLLILTLSACQNGTPDPTPTLEITDNDTEPTDNDQPSNGAVEGEEKPPTPALPEREQPTEDDLELVGLILYNHDLTDSDFLESRTVTGPSGAEYPVTVITGGFGEANVPSQLFWEHDAIVLLYELWYDTEDLWFDDIETAHDLIASLLMERMSWLGSFTETGGISL